MNHLLRELAPVASGAWSEIDGLAKKTLQLGLAGRRVVDLRGPLGWEAAAIATGRVDPLQGAPAEGVCALRRRSQELVELLAPFELERKELDALSRGDAGADLAPVVKAAKAIGLAEDRAIFHGFPEGGIGGLIPSSPHAPLRLPERFNDYPSVVIEALETLRNAGVDGPYGIALGARCYTGLLEAVDPSGYPVMQRLGKVMEGPLVRAPAVDGALVLSLRGGDFELALGADLSIGYLSHTEQRVRLQLVETMTFRVLSPEAAIHLAHP